MNWLEKLSPRNPATPTELGGERSLVRPAAELARIPSASPLAFPPDINNLKSFFYIDEDQVLNLYQQLVPLQLTAVQAQATKRVKRRFGFRFGKGPEAASERGSDDALTQNYTAVQSPASMYQAVEPHLLQCVTVIDGTTLLDETVAFFDSFFQLAEERTSFVIPPEVRDAVYTAIRREAAIRQRDQISELRGFVRFFGDFLVTTSSEDVHLDYQHPANRWLDYDDPAVHLRVQFNSARGLSESGRNHFRDGSPARATCVGKVAGWDKHSKRLHVSPVVIY